VPQTGSDPSVRRLIMHLFELTDESAACHREARPAGVPAWALGCFRRRSITFFTGAEDVQTEVLWLQSRGLTADFRRSPPRLGVPSRAALAERPLAELLALARVEGGLARTRWDGRLMHWSDWDSFQTHAKWPEPGLLTRVGNSLIELAPSGAYVEDWRFQACGSGPLIGLSLLDERDAQTGEVLHRGGGLIVCGRHAAFVRGRPEPLPAGGRLVDYVRDHAGDAAALERVFAFDASYAASASGRDDFTVSASTLPWREGEPLLSLDGFSRLPGEPGLLLQRIEERARLIERRFVIDTLEREFSDMIATDATPAARLWLQEEGDTLLATVR
jgi:hypothetical protein